MERLLVAILFVVLSGVVAIAQDVEMPKNNMEASVSINTHYQFQDVKIGYGIAIGGIKQKSTLIRRYLGLELNMNFNPLTNYTVYPNKGINYSASVAVDRLCFVDALVPVFYEFSIFKKRSHLFFDLGGYISLPLGGNIKGIQTEYSSPTPPLVTALDERMSGRFNLGGIVGFGMKIPMGESEFLTIRMDTRMDLLHDIIGYWDYFNNRYLKLTIGYALKGK